MRDGDDLLLLEKDVGDGWTRVRHQRSNAEGFVPTSYLVGCPFNNKIIYLLCNVGLQMVSDALMSDRKK
jgi:hypothetical protein